MVRAKVDLLPFTMIPVVKNIFSTATDDALRVKYRFARTASIENVAHSSFKMLVDPLGQPKFLYCLKYLFTSSRAIDLPSAQTSCASEQVSSSWNMWLHCSLHIHIHRACKWILLQAHLLQNNLVPGTLYSMTSQCYLGTKPHNICFEMN